MHQANLVNVHVRISKDRFTETVFLKNSNQVSAIVMVHFMVHSPCGITTCHLVEEFRFQIPESRFQNKIRTSRSKLVQRSTSGGCGLISFEVGQGSRPTFRCGQEVKA